MSTHTKLHRHPSLPQPVNEPSQEDKILECLRAARGRWVPMPKLAAYSGSMNIHTRIDGLRQKGFGIENHQERRRDTRSRDSFYRLVHEIHEAPPASTEPELDLKP